MSFYKDYLKKKEEERKKMVGGGLEDLEFKNKITKETITAEKSSESGINLSIDIEKLKNKVSELQKREDSEREKFLKRVKNEEPSLIIPNKEETSVEGVPMYLPQKPPKGNKIFVRIVIIVIIVLIIVAASLVWYRVVQNMNSARIKTIDQVAIKENNISYFK